MMTNLEKKILIEDTKIEILKKITKWVAHESFFGNTVFLSDLVALFPDMFEEKVETVKSHCYNEYYDEYEDKEVKYSCYRLKGDDKWYGGTDNPDDAEDN